MSQKRLRLSRRRPQLSFTPEWSGIIQGWATNYMTRNVWRTLPMYDRDDLMQEAFIIFNRVKETYPNVIDAPHFMRLFQCSCVNYMNRISLRRSNRKEVPLSVQSRDEEGGALQWEICSDDPGFDEMTYRLLIEDAPEEIRTILNRIVADDGFLRGESGQRETTEERMARLKSYRRVRHMREDGVRETTNQLLCRLASLDPEEYDLVGMIRNWITGDGPCSACINPSTSTSPIT